MSFQQPIRRFASIAIILCLALTARTQDYSNKGKDFWLCYPNHIDGTGSRMALYISSTVNTSGVVEMPSGPNIPFVVRANEATVVQIFPGAYPGLLNTQSEGINVRNAIHITSLAPIVVYSHILNAARSGSTLVLPTPTLGREYTASSFRSSTGSGNSGSQFVVIGIQDNTSVEIIPTATDVGNTRPVGVPYTITLNRGDVYQFRTVFQADVTGTKIRSIASPSAPCQPIAVFSGSTWTTMDCPNASGGDNLYQQMMPKSSLGKYFITAPFATRGYDIFRVIVDDPATQVTLNGTVLSAATLYNNSYYQFNSSTPNEISTDKPVTVVQYMISNTCDNVLGDPEMIILNPIEQTINDVTVVSARRDLTPPQTNITSHFFTVIMKTVAIGSLRIDGVAPTGTFTPIGATGYSYLHENVTNSTLINPSHRINADSGFVALAYGTGSVESYGYNAGTNVRDLYQYVTVQNQYAQVNFPAACKNSPFKFAMTFPYQPTEIRWIFGAALNAMGIADVTVTNPVYDSNWVVNGKQLYRYKLPGFYTINTPGTYMINVTAQNPTPDGCSGLQEVEYELRVFERPHADFTYIANGCTNNDVRFTDASNLEGRPAILWNWDFGDLTTNNTQNPTHSYTAPGTYNVKYSLITDVGCVSDTAEHPIQVTDVPVAAFTKSATEFCANKPITFTNASTITPAGGSSIVKWTWDFGDGPPVVVNAPNPPDQVHTYAAPGTYNVTLQVESNTGCTSVAFTDQVVIGHTPVADFNLPVICLPTASAQFNDLSTITNGTIVTWAWDFGDGNTSALQNPLHNYTGPSPFNVTLTVTTNSGCSGTKTQVLNTVYAEPLPAFQWPAEVCLGNPATFTDQSTAPGSSVTQWAWDFGDGNTSTLQNPTHTYAAAGTYTVSLRVTSAVGCQTVNNTARHTVVVNPLPTADFNNSALVCANTAITLTSTSVPNAGTITQYAWTINSTPTGGNNAVINFTPTTAGTYTIVLSVTTDKGCTAQVTKSLTVNAKPVANFNTPSICLPSGTANFTSTSTVAGGTIVAYAWDFGDGNTSNLQNPTNTYAGVGPYNVSLTVTSNSGCTDTKTQALTTIYAEPQAAFTAPPEVCLGAAANFTDNSTAPASSVAQWNWDFGDGNTSTSQNPSHTYAAAGTYTVTLRVTSAVGCATVTTANIASRPITVNRLPTADFTNSALVCANSPVTLTSTSVANSGTITQYAWTINSTPTGGNNAVINFTPTTAGSYTIVLNVTTDKGCTAQVTKSLTVNAKPVANFTLPNVCLPAGTANFTSTSTVAGGTIVSYAWDFGDGNTSAVQNPTNTYSATGPYNVTLTVTSNQGCTDTKTQSLTTIYAEPQAAFTAPAEVCVGSAANFTDNSTAPASSVTQWAWDFGDGNTSTVKNPSHTYAAAGTYTVTLRVTSAIGCPTVTPSHIATWQVTVNPLPSSDFNISLPGCVTRNITFTDASVANAGTLTTWSWNFGDAGTSNVANPVHAYTTAGTYNVTLQVTSSKGCVSTVRSKPVNIHVLPNAEFTNPEACINDVSAQFTDNSTVSPGTVTNWLWNFGDVNATGGNPNTSNVQNATHHFTVAGNYNITLIAYSNEGCTDTLIKPLFVNGAVLGPGLVVQNTGPLCSDKVITVKDGSTIDIGNITKVEVYWDYTNDITQKLVNDNPTSGETYTHTYPEFGTPATKTITIRYVVYSGATCMNYVDRVITLLATPTLQFTPVPSVCEDAPSFQVTQAQLLNGMPGTGAFSGAGISNTGLFNPATAGVGQHPITYTFTGTNGCEKSISRVIEVNAKPGVNAGPDKFVLEGGSVTLTPSVNSGTPVTYLWTPPTYLSNPAISNPAASPVADITYRLTVTSDKGCTNYDDVFVKVLKNPIIPNIFSPNGDNIHDRWELPYLETYPGCTVDVYNRYGQLVFHSVGYSKPWDGKVNGKDVPVGTYYYVIDPKNGRARLAGYVDVIR